MISKKDQSDAGHLNKNMHFRVKKRFRRVAATSNSNYVTHLNKPILGEMSDSEIRAKNSQEVETTQKKNVVKLHDSYLHKISILQ